MEKAGKIRYAKCNPVGEFINMAKFRDLEFIGEVKEVGAGDFARKVFQPENTIQVVKPDVAGQGSKPACRRVCQVQQGLGGKIIPAVEVYLLKAFGKIVVQIFKGIYGIGCTKLVAPAIQAYVKMRVMLAGSTFDMPFAKITQHSLPQRLSHEIPVLNRTNAI